MHRLRTPGFIFLCWVGAGGGVSWPALSLRAQTPTAPTSSVTPGAETTPAPTTTPAPPLPITPPSPPPPPPADTGLFPGAADGSGAPRTLPPPLPASGELRRAGAARNAGTPGAAAAAGQRRRVAGGDRLLGGEQRRRLAENPSLAAAIADPVEVRIAYRRAETEAKRDPVFMELLRRADVARDDEERRALLRRYYVDLFARVRRINSSPALAAHVALLARTAEQRYAPKRQPGGLDERELSRDRGDNRR